MDPVDPASYDAILPLIEDAKRDGTWVRCTFRCPLTGVRIEAQAPLKTNHDPTSSGKLTEDDFRLTVQRAFRSVQARFVWEAGQRWISVEAAAYVVTEFVQLYKTAPPHKEVDRQLLARKLTEITTTGGALGQQARELIGEFMPDRAGADGPDFDELAAMPPLTEADYGACSAGLVRDTMLMLVWGVVLAGGRTISEHEQRLSDFARGLAIEPVRAAELKRHAQIYLVDQALERAYASKQRGAAQFLAARRRATDVGHGDEEAERIDARLRKRLGGS